MNGAKKRKLAAGSVSLLAKRKKTSAVPQKSKRRSKRSVGLDSLPWSKAKLPEMFDDAEGFYGLEEVDDVEVVRGSGNIIEFVGLCHIGSISRLASVSNKKL